MYHPVSYARLGFRGCHSTEAAALTVTDGVTETMNQEKIPPRVLLGFSKCCGLGDHLLIS